MKDNKRGLSTVVTTLIIVLLVLVAIGIIWGVVNNLVQENLEGAGSCYDMFDKVGLNTFTAAAGTNNYIGFIVVGTMAWMWVNITMWEFGTYLRQEQMFGTLESNWLCPIKKFDFLNQAGVHLLKEVVF